MPSNSIAHIAKNSMDVLGGFSGLHDLVIQVFVTFICEVC